MTNLNHLVEPAKLLGFAGYSGSGKTTLIEQVIPLLRQHGLHIALVKHSHHDVELDKPGKDTYRHRKAGAEQVVLTGPNRHILFKELARKKEAELSEALTMLDTRQLDLVLVEGFRDEIFSKIEVYRPQVNKPKLHPNDRNIIAVATNQATLDTNLRLLDINNPNELVQFILQWLDQ